MLTGIAIGYLLGLATAILAFWTGEALKGLETGYRLPEPPLKAIGRLAQQQERPLRGAVKPNGEQR